MENFRLRGQRGPHDKKIVGPTEAQILEDRAKLEASIEARKQLPTDEWGNIIEEEEED